MWLTNFADRLWVRLSRSCVLGSDALMIRSGRVYVCGLPLLFLCGCAWLGIGQPTSSTVTSLAPPLSEVASAPVPKQIGYSLDSPLVTVMQLLFGRIYGVRLLGDVCQEAGYDVQLVRDAWETENATDVSQVTHILSQMHYGHGSNAEARLVAHAIGLDSKIDAAGEQLAEGCRSYTEALQLPYYRIKQAYRQIRVDFLKELSSDPAMKQGVTQSVPTDLDAALQVLEQHMPSLSKPKEDTQTLPDELERAPSQSDVTMLTAPVAVRETPPSGQMSLNDFIEMTVGPQNKPNVNAVSVPSEMTTPLLEQALPVNERPMVPLATSALTTLPAVANVAPPTESPLPTANKTVSEHSGALGQAYPAITIEGLIVPKSQSRSALKAATLFPEVPSVVPTPSAKLVTVPTLRQVPRALTRPPVVQEPTSSFDGRAKHGVYPMYKAVP